MEKQNDLMTRREVMQLLKISPVTLSSFTKAGRLTYYKVGRRLLFDRAEVLNEIRNPKKI